MFPKVKASAILVLTPNPNPKRLHYPSDYQTFR